MSTIDVLRSALKHKLNVCMSAKHGVGKTAMVKELFNKEFGEIGKDWLYLSGSTLDPWVDFVGIPREETDKNGKFLSLIKPKPIRDGLVKGIFVDEYNRSPAKVRNAIMELTQFKTINGHPMPNLQVVWIAVNPYDANETYNVEPIDPAQLDRFQVQIEVPYDVDQEYFFKTFGEIGSHACVWWRTLTDKQKDMVSPRRLEYAVQAYQSGMSLDHIIPTQADRKGLLKHFTDNTPASRLSKMIKNKEWNEAKKLLSDPGSLNQCMPVIESNIDLFNREKLLNEEQKRWLSVNSSKYANILRKEALNNQNDYAKKYSEFLRTPSLTVANYSNKHKAFFGYPRSYKVPMLESHKELSLEDSLRKLIEENKNV